MPATPALPELDHIEIEQFSPLGDTPLVACEAAFGAARYRNTNAIIIGTDSQGALPQVDEEEFDILLTTAKAAPRPWTTLPANALQQRLQTYDAAIRTTPHAAAVLRQTLRINEALPFDQALHVESFAYSTLLAGEEFRRWRKANPAQTSATPHQAKVDYTREGDHVTLTLNAPETRNAMTAAMRDALYEALAAVADDPSRPNVTLRGAGACFSIGGALEEFGANPDLAAAHTIRTTRSVARLIDELGDRIETMFHGACIGSGLEAPAAAHKRSALSGAFFQLPELKMGLIPGAGGTVTIPRAVGRHRACAMMLSGARVSAATALEWGLLHNVEESA